jgi:plastocyanin
MSRLALSCIPGLLLFAACASHGALLDAQVRDALAQPIADAVVYALPAGGGVDAKPGRTHVIEQLDREFVPYVSVIQAGTAVAFPNRDPIMHHVYSFSPAKPFEIKLYAGKSPTEIVFDKAGVITLGCNIHDWMLGFILVVATPYYAKSDARGNARLHDLPPGAYEVHAWHPQQRTAAAPQRLTLESGMSPGIAFTLDPVARKAKFKPPLDRLKY